MRQCFKKPRGGLLIPLTVFKNNMGKKICRCSTIQSLLLAFRFLLGESPLLLKTSNEYYSIIPRKHLRFIGPLEKMKFAFVFPFPLRNGLPLRLKHSAQKHLCLSRQHANRLQSVPASKNMHWSLRDYYFPNLRIYSVGLCFFVILVSFLPSCRSWLFQIGRAHV